MLTDGSQLWAVLRGLDDPEHVEYPAGYDHGRARGLFEELARRLDADFGCSCQVERQVQDASLHGRIDIPPHATATGRALIISISNFGSLAVLSVDNPGVWADGEVADLLEPHDAGRIRTALDDLGYILIPEEPLWTRYDGACDPRVLGPEASWWIRYFDYL